MWIGAALAMIRDHPLTGVGLENFRVAYPRYRPLCEELGVEFYLEKPVALDMLLTLVKRLTA